MAKIANLHSEYIVDGVRVVVHEVHSPATVLSALGRANHGYTEDELRDRIQLAGGLGRASKMQLLLETEALNENTLMMRQLTRIVPAHDGFGAASNDPTYRILDALHFLNRHPITNSPPNMPPDFQRAFEEPGPIESNTWGHNRVPYSWVGDLIRIVAETIARGVDVVCACAWGVAIGAKRAVWPTNR